MPKPTPVSAQEAPRHLVFEIEALRVEFADAGSGVAVMVPERRRQALVLTYHDLTQLHALIGSVLARP